MKALITSFAIMATSLSASTSLAILDGVSVSGTEYAAVATSKKVWDRVTKMDGYQIDGITRNSMVEGIYLVHVKDCSFAVEVKYTYPEVIPGKPEGYPIISGVKVLKDTVCNVN